MSRTPFIVIASIPSLAMVTLAAVYGSRIPFAEQWPLYEALRTTASIIFAVVGAWLAIVYPDRLRLAFGLNAQLPKASSERFSTLLTPIAHSSIILCVVLFIGIAAPIARNIELVIANADLARTLSFVLLVVLTLWQLFTVVLTLVPADEMKSNADLDASREQSLSTLRGLGQAERPPV